MIDIFCAVVKWCLNLLYSDFQAKSLSLFSKETFFQQMQKSFELHWQTKYFQIFVHSCLIFIDQHQERVVASAGAVNRNTFLVLTRFKVSLPSSLWLYYFMCALLVGTYPDFVFKNHYVNSEILRGFTQLGLQNGVLDFIFLVSGLR